MTRSRVDLPQPDGPISETNSPGWKSSSMFWSATVPPLPNVFETLRIETAGGGHATFSGARRTTSLSAIATMQKKAIPSAAAMMFVAQSAEGSSE